MSHRPFVLNQKKSFRICKFSFRQQKSQYIWFVTSVLCLAIEWSSKITLQAVSINQSGISFCCSGVIWHSCYAFVWLTSPEQTSASERYEWSGVSSSRLWIAPFFHSLIEDTRDTMRTVIWQLFWFRLRTACGSNSLYCQPVARIRTAHLLLNFIGYTAGQKNVRISSLLNLFVETCARMRGACLLCQC